MTWDDLAKRILEMSESERTQTVQYRESWENDPEIYAVDLHEAKEDLATPEGAVGIRKGEVFLQ